MRAAERFIERYEKEGQHVGTEVEVSEADFIEVSK